MSADHFSIAIHVPFNQNWKYGEKYSLTKSILVEFCCQCLKEKNWEPVDFSSILSSLSAPGCCHLLLPTVAVCGQQIIWISWFCQPLLLLLLMICSHILRATNKLCGSVDLVRPLFFSPLRSICARPHFPNHFTHFNKQPQNWPRQENHFF